MLCRRIIDTDQVCICRAADLRGGGGGGGGLHMQKVVFS